MTAKEYKQYKGLRKESLRYTMDSIEVILTDFSEETTKRLVEKHRPLGLEQNKEIAKMVVMQQKLQEMILKRT